jgi:O-antigen/teichoic acid export membrane protein
VNPRLQQLVETLYGPFFKVIGFFFRTFTRNRKRLKRLKAKETISAAIKGLAVITLIAWIAIWLFASEESRQRLSEEVKAMIGDLGTSEQQ